MLRFTAASSFRVTVDRFVGISTAGACHDGPRSNQLYSRRQRQGKSSVSFPGVLRSVREVTKRSRRYHGGTGMPNGPLTETDQQTRRTIIVE